MHQTVSRYRPPLTLVTLLMQLVLLLLVLLQPSQANVNARGQVMVKALSLFYGKGWPMDVINAVNAGFNASLSARNWTVGPGVGVEIIQPPTYSTPPQVYLKEYLEGLNDSDSLVVVMGPMGEESTTQSYDTLEEHGVVGFGAMTGTDGLAEFLPHLYYLRVGLSGELMALIRYAVNYLRVLRLGFMHLNTMMGGSERYEEAADYASRMGYSLCCLFTVEPEEGSTTASPEDFDAAWNEFASGDPQAVIMFSTMKSDAKKFLVRLVSDNRTEEAFLLAPFFLQRTIVDIWKEALETANVMFVPHRVFQTGVNPLAKDDYHLAIQHFQVQMRNYLREYKEWSGFDDEDHFLTNDPDGELMVSGWIVGEVLLQALRGHGWMNNRTAFLESLYEQRRYVIDDIIIGDFGGECGDTAVATGAICTCNSGGRKVYMKEIGENYALQPQLGGEVATTPLQCSTDASILRPPLSGVIVVMEDQEHLGRAAAQLEVGVSAATSVERVDEAKRFFLQRVTTSTQRVFDDLVTLRGSRAVTAVFGVVAEQALKLQKLTFITPITPTPHLNRFSKNVIHLSPTLEQQLYVLAAYLSAARGDTAHCVVRGPEANGIIDVLRKTLVTFGMSLSSANVLGAEDPIEGRYLPEKGELFLIGLIAGDVTTIEKHLRTHAAARVFVPFADVALLYNELIHTFNSSDGAKHLVFATNLPHWADANSASETVRRFHASVPAAEDWSPLALLGFATGRLMQQNLQHMDSVTPELLSSVFFNEIVITVDDMRYGPYKHRNCIDDGFAIDSDCTSNFGARDISVWSAARALNPDEPVLQGPISPSMSYHVPGGGSLTPSQIAGVVVGCVAVALLFAALGVVLHLTLRNARDNDRAPREPTDPVTLVFSDIESSTAQWAACSELMPDAVAAHHRLIRALIAKYGCYEVKTVGDSFMIASKSPFAAVQLARDLQQCFLHLDWGTAAFDEFYREFEEQRAEGDSEYTPPTARLDPDVYGRLWSGLRVRVGIHTGLCDIRRDEVTKGYDYYGRTPNMAARTESVANGGQVLLTHAAYMSLGSEERQHLAVVALGTMMLRGVPEPVRMWQLDAVPGRTFAALRLDRAADCFDGSESDTTTSCSDRSSSVAELNFTAQNVAISLQALLGAFSPAQRQDALIPFCKRWRVALPRRAELLWDDGCCQEAVLRISAKVGHVVDARGTDKGETTRSTLSSSSTIVVHNRDVDLAEITSRLMEKLCCPVLAACRWERCKCPGTRLTWHPLT